MRTLSRGNAEAVPSQAGAGVLGSSMENVFALRKSPLPLLARRLGLPDTGGHAAQASLRAALGLWVINPVSRQRCQSEARRSAPYRQLSACGRLPLVLLLRVQANTDLEPAGFSSDTGIFSFSLLVLILPPCFILSRLS